MAFAAGLRSGLVHPGGGQAAAAQHRGQRPGLEQVQRRDAGQHQTGAAAGQHPLAQQAGVAGEEVELHADRIAAREQLLQPDRLHAPACPVRAAGMQGRVVAQHPGAQHLQQLRQPARGGPHADQPDGAVAELAPAGRRRLARIGPQQRHQRAEQELGLGRRGGIRAAHHLDTGALAGMEVDALWPAHHPADGQQSRQSTQQPPVDRHRGGQHRRASLRQQVCQHPCVLRQTGRVEHLMTLLQPAQHLGLKRFSNKQVHEKRQNVKDP